MAKTISFVVLVGLILLVGAVFVAVIRQFLLPLFLALLLVIMFRPLHEWFVKKLPKHPRAAAGLTTLAIVLIVQLPLLYIFVQAGMEAVALVQSADPETVVNQCLKQGARLTAKARVWAKRFDVEIPEDPEIANRAKTALKDSIVPALKDYVAPAALRTTEFVFSLLFGIAIMLISMYFFFADGPEMVESTIKLTPMDPQYVRHLLDQFDQVSRAVVLATLLSAVGQGLLAGIGYFAVGMPRLFLVTALTGLLALVPFIGATAIWLPVSVWLYFFAPYASPDVPGGIAYGRPGAAIALAIWGALVVSMADNFIKPYVLKGQSNMHPLLALLSVIGGVQVLGPIGIFVGPMVVAFLHALLTLLRGALKGIEAAENSVQTAAALGAPPTPQV